MNYCLANAKCQLRTVVDISISAKKLSCVFVCNFLKEQGKNLKLIWHKDIIIYYQNTQKKFYYILSKYTKKYYKTITGKILN